MSTSAGSGAKKKAPEPDTAAAAAAAAGEQARDRRRRRAKLRGYGDDFMDMDVQVEPDWKATELVGSTPASGQGAGTMGFAGTARGEAPDTAVEAAGLATVAGDGFGGRPLVPPGSGHLGKLNTRRLLMKIIFSKLHSLAESAVISAVGAPRQRV